MLLIFPFAPSPQFSPIEGEEVILGNIYHILTFPPTGGRELKGGGI
jgi:hypothetical protein